MRRAIFVIASVALVAAGSITLWELVGGNDPRPVAAITSTSEPVTLTWRGPWAPDARYAPGQVVSHRGASFVADRASTNSEPNAVCSSDCAWSVLGVRGAGGAAGPSELDVKTVSGPPSVGTEPAVVASMAIEPGRYVIHAVVDWLLLSQGAAQVSCFMHFGTDLVAANVLDTERATLEGANDRAELTLRAARSVTTTQPHTVRCERLSGIPNPILDKVRFETLKVDRLTVDGVNQ